jgi:AcrR family transcriptional regulator
MIFVKQAYHHKDLRNALVDEALAILAEKGSGEITLRDLARRLGVTHTAPYAHFADKKSLLEAIADEGFARLTAVLDAAGGSGASPEERLYAQGLAYVTFARENPNLYRLMFADPELANDPDCVWSEESDRAFASVLNTLAAIGVPEGTNTIDVALATWSMVHGVAMLEIDRRFKGQTAIPGKTPVPNGDEIVRLLTSYLLAGLRT